VKSRPDELRDLVYTFCRLSTSALGHVRGFTGFVSQCLPPQAPPLG
jgi:hypothetical protein